MIETDIENLWTELEDLSETELDQALSSTLLVDGEDEKEKKRLRRQEYAQRGKQRKLDELITSGKNTRVYALTESADDLIPVMVAEEDNCLRIARAYAKGDMDKAKDIHQTANIRAYYHIKSGEPFTMQRKAIKRIQKDDEQVVDPKAQVIVVKSPVAWLHCIVRNTANNEIRKEKRTNKLLENWRRDLERESPRFESPETTVLREIANAELHHYVECLAKQSSKIISLHFFEGLTYEEIAKELNCPPCTVRTQARRALAMLKDVIQNKRIIKDGKIVRQSNQKPNLEKVG